jgi:hypothetical protein
VINTTNPTPRPNWKKSKDIHHQIGRTKIIAHRLIWREYHQMRVLYKLWRPTWSQHINWSVLQRSPDFWCSPRVLKLCPHKYGDMVVYALHETNGPQFPASTQASSTHKNYQHAPSYSCEYSKSILLRISLSEDAVPMPVGSWNNCLHARNTTVWLTGTHCTTSRAFGAESAENWKGAAGPKPCT